MIPYAEDFFLNILHYKAFLLSKNMHMKENIVHGQGNSAWY